MGLGKLTEDATVIPRATLGQMTVQFALESLSSLPWNTHRVRYPFSQTAIGLTVATSNGVADQISFEYTGPNDLIQS